MQNAFRLTALLVIASAITACGGPPTKKYGDGWRNVSTVGDGRIQIVKIDNANLKNGKIYRDAIEGVCPNQSCVQVGFFASSDDYPGTKSSQMFFDTGGWSRYRPLAVWTGNEFTTWDCERAGVESAPASALCGDGVAEAHEAVLNLATREGWVESCGLPPFDGESLVKRYVATIKSEDQKSLLDAAFYKMRASGREGPDEKSSCRTLRSKIVSNGERAKQVLQKEIAKAESKPKAG